jgi:hypothetical protein
MSRVRAADDFEAIRLRLEELRRERQQHRYGGELAATSPAPRPDAVARVPGHIVRRYLSEARRSSSR